MFETLHVSTTQWVILGGVIFLTPFQVRNFDLQLLFVQRPCKQVQVDERAVRAVHGHSVLLHLMQIGAVPLRHQENCHVLLRIVSRRFVSAHTAACARTPTLCRPSSHLTNFPVAVPQVRSLTTSSTAMERRISLRNGSSLSRVRAIIVLVFSTGYVLFLV